MNTITAKATAVAFSLALLAVAGCGSSGNSDSSTAVTTAAGITTTTAPASITIADAWARTSPSAVTKGAAYMTITSPIDDKLIGASVPASIAKTTEVHETVAVDSGSTTTGGMGATTTESMMTATTGSMGGTTVAGDMGGGDELEMRPVESIDLPATVAVALEPGGYHVMLIDLVAPLEAGQTFPLTLSFDVAGDRTVTVTVRDA